MNEFFKYILIDKKDQCILSYLGEIKMLRLNHLTQRAKAYA